MTSNTKKVILAILVAIGAIAAVVIAGPSTRAAVEAAITGAENAVQSVPTTDTDTDTDAKAIDTDTKDTDAPAKVADTDVPVVVVDTDVPEAGADTDVPAKH